MDRVQIHHAINEAYGRGRPVEGVLCEYMEVIRSGADPYGRRVSQSDMESGRTIYRKRKCGKVASFFRCLLR